MKKIFTALFLTIIGIYNASAQSTPNVLKLKNGSIINCTALEADSAKVKVKTNDGSIWVFKMTEVEVLQYTQSSAPTTNVAPVSESVTPVAAATIQPAQVATVAEPVQNQYNVKTVKNGLHPGFYLSVDAAYGSAKYTRGGGLSTSMGYRFNPHFSIGMGTGLKVTKISTNVDSYSNGMHSYNNDWENTTSIPLYAEFKLNFSNSAISPFISGMIGYNFAESEYNLNNSNGSDNSMTLTKGNNGVEGRYFGARAGVNIKTANDRAITIAGIVETYGEGEYSNGYDRYITMGMSLGYSF